MRFPLMVMRLRCGPALWGSTSQTTFVEVIYFRLSTGMSEEWITLNVSASPDALVVQTIVFFAYALG